MTEQRITEVLEAFPEVRFALLFGSRAGGRPRPDSDWDVAVYLDPAMTKQDRFRTRLRLTASLAGPGTDVDVLVLNDADAIVAHHALRGRTLLNRDREMWVQFVVRTLRDADDERFYLELHHQVRRRRLAEDRFGRA